MHDEAIGNRSAALLGLGVCLTVCILGALGCSRASEPPPNAFPDVSTAPTVQRPQGPQRWGSGGNRGPLAAPELLQTRRITPMSIELDDDTRASLRQNKRKYTRATVTIDGTKLLEVGVRLKGNRSMRELGEGASFIVDFQRFAPGRRYQGLRRVLLHAMAEDPTRLRETLGYMLYRKVGVPAPRTGYVNLSIDGAKPVLYLAIQAIDDVMLAEHFADSSGNLYEGEYGCDVRASDVWGFELDSGADTSRADLKRLAALMPRGVTAVFADRDGAVDRQRVLAYLAMSALIGDFDGYRHHHNFYLYHDPSRRRWTMLPWGIDRVLYDDIGLFDSDGVLARMCLHDAKCRLDYVRALQAGIKAFEAADLPSEASRLSALIGPGRERDELLTFVRERPKTAKKQAACLRNGLELDRDDDGYGCLDCDDHDANVHPGAAELCDGKDNNCSGVTDDSPTCPCRRAVVEGAEFEFCDRELTWPAAAASCRGKGLHLARIDNKDQAKGVWRYARNLHKTRWWIGLNDRAQESEHVWHDGAPPDFAYWSRRQPTDDGCAEDCTAIASGGKGKWYTSNCELKRPFVCR